MDDDRRIAVHGLLIGGVLAVRNAFVGKDLILLIGVLVQIEVEKVGIWPDDFLAGRNWALFVFLFGTLGLIFGRC